MGIKLIPCGDIDVACAQRKPSAMRERSTPTGNSFSTPDGSHPRASCSAPGLRALRGFRAPGPPGSRSGATGVLSRSGEFRRVGESRGRRIRPMSLARADFLLALLAIKSR